MIYVVFGLVIFVVCALFLGVYLSPAFVLVISFLLTFAFVTTYTISNRYPNGALRRAYLSDMGSFELKTELMKVLRFEHFIAEVLAYITFGIALSTIVALRAEITSVFKLLRGTIVIISRFAIPFSLIDIVFWLLIRYRWYKDRKDLLSGKRKKRTYVIK